MQTLEFSPGATWSQYFTISQDGQLIGDSTWGADFSIYTKNGCNDELVAQVTTGAGIVWYSPGTLIVTFQQSETAGWAWNQASWYLGITNPDTTYDPAGFRMIVASGVGVIKSVTPSKNSYGFPSNPIIPFPYKV